MTYNKNEILGKILKEFLDKRIISLKDYLDMLRNVENCQLVDDFLIDCIIKFKISYSNYPLDYGYDVVFLKKLIEKHPKVCKELKKSAPVVYNMLYANVSVIDEKNNAPFQKKKGLIKVTFDKVS